MDKHLWLSLLRLVDEGSAEELQAKKEELLQSLERLRITRWNGVLPTATGAA